MRERRVRVAFMVAVAIAAAGGAVQVSARGAAAVAGAGVQSAGVLLALGTLGVVYRKVRRQRRERDGRPR